MSQVMFNWFRKKPDPARRPQSLRPIPPPPPPVTSIRRSAAPPPAAPANPDPSTLLRISLSNDREQWTEKVDLLELLIRVLEKHGYASKPRDDGWLEIGESKIIVKPTFEGGQPLDRLGARTCTTIQARHPILFPEGVFEFQHSTGANFANSVGKGYEGWVLGDLVVLLNALGEEPQGCTFMNMPFPAKEGQPERKRRAVLGPVAHFRQHPPASTGQNAQQSPADQNHDFCSCCFLTNSIHTFKPLVAGDGFFAIRMYAMRGEDGSVAADCRVNGQEFEEGKAALRRYVSTWPQAGFEFRKQYVVLQTLQSPATTPPAPAAT